MKKATIRLKTAFFAALSNYQRSSMARTLLFRHPMHDSSIAKILHVGKTSRGDDIDILVAEDGTFQIRIGENVTSSRFPADRLEEAIAELRRPES